MPEELEGFSLLTNSISDTIGISNNLLWIGLFIFIGLAISISSYVMTKSYIVSSICSCVICGCGVFMGVLPLWVFFIILLVSVITISYRMFNCSVSDKEETTSNVKDKNVYLKIDSADIVKMDKSQCDSIMGAIDKICGLNNKDNYIRDDNDCAYPIKTFSNINKNRNWLLSSLELKSREFEKYHNNLDELLKIHTINVPYDCKDEIGLELFHNELRINDNYDWFIVDKHPEFNIFKVVGIHKKDGKLNCVYLLGNKDNNPFLFKLDNKHINDDASVEQLLKEYEKSDILKMEMA
jgi:hypothetical protein